MNMYTRFRLVPKSMTLDDPKRPTKPKFHHDILKAPIAETEMYMQQYRLDGTVATMLFISERV